MKKEGFTLAEVLITLAIIGVVAALTIPAVIKNYQTQVYDRARQKALKSIGEAGKIMAVQNFINNAASAEDFVKNYLPRYLKITKTCANAQDCHFPSTIKTMFQTTVNTPTQWNQLNSNIYGYKLVNSSSNRSYFFTTADGYAVNLFYNRNCVSGYQELPYLCGYAYTNVCIHFSGTRGCFNALYDMNGLKPPNQMGKDIGFVTVFYPGIDTIAVAPGISEDISTTTYTNANGISYCKGLGNEYNLPSMDELSGMQINRDLITNITSGELWSGSPIPSYATYVWFVGSDGHRSWGSRGNSTYVRCVKR